MIDQLTSLRELRNRTRNKEGEAMATNQLKHVIQILRGAAEDAFQATFLVLKKAAKAVFFSSPNPRLQVSRLCKCPAQARR
jgi:hypothetical protein